MQKTLALLSDGSGGVLSLGAQAPPSDIPKLDIEKYTLANGLEVILSEDHRVPLVGVDLWYHVGPAHEAPGRTGFAHLFEHMMFQGSKHIESDAHFKLLAGGGATGVNGTTGFDRTNYFETMPSNQLELALWLESDRMGYLLETVDQAKLTNQQDVVRNERRQSTRTDRTASSRKRCSRRCFRKGIRTTASSSDRTPTFRPRSSTTSETFSGSTTRRTTRRLRSPATSTRRRPKSSSRNISAR